MLAEERRQLIADIIRREGSVVAKDLSEMFDLSIDSVRRDLTIMENQGLLQKTYGGAVSNRKQPKVRTLPQSEEIRYGKGEPHQNAISKQAASMIRKHDTVFIGGAGIQYGMLSYLPEDIPFTVITNSMKIAEELRLRDNIDSYLIGGKIRRESAGGNFNDTLAIEMISKFTIDIGFLTGGGIASCGISMSTPDNASFNRAVAQASRRTVALAPHEKLGLRMFVLSVPLESIDLIITDQVAPASVLAELERNSVPVQLADEKAVKGRVEHEMV
ncbi:DeoR/GlpR family DNA-binding transcription regulator [Paenibacillus sp. HB172176]|uniref:DeoR/GlpR family DNA-binding transcription regulator n=1 Tax=Paenibacillus sp. HB172176 TaxID=2493690 RepID=UPI00143C673B|nr:DeoR/GlpR family DNA-binding transcription regulator [Paenibacillus sp. HB172176]